MSPRLSSWLKCGQKPVWREHTEHVLTEEHGDVELILPVHSSLDHYDVDGVQHRPRQRPQRTFKIKYIWRECFKLYKFQTISGPRWSSAGSLWLQDSIEILRTNVSSLKKNQLKAGQRFTHWAKLLWLVLLTFNAFYYLVLTVCITYF